MSEQTPTTRLLVEITWHGNYYLPDERAEMAREWIEGALADRDDSPGVEIREAAADPIAGLDHDELLTAVNVIKAYIRLCGSRIPDDHRLHAVAAKLAARVAENGADQ